MNNILCSEKNKRAFMKLLMNVSEAREIFLLKKFYLFIHNCIVFIPVLEDSLKA